MTMTDTELLSRAGTPDPVAVARWFRAVRAFNKQLPIYTSVARAIAKNPKLEVKLTNGTPCTDGKTVWLRCPIELGDIYVHNRQLCARRDEKSHPMCPACRQSERVDQTLLHELAHILHGTFQQIEDRDKASLIQKIVSENPAIKGSRLDKIQEVVRQAWLSPMGANYMGIASLVSPFLPVIINALEDARVNRAMYEVRAGTYHMFRSKMIDIFENGVTRPDGTSFRWKNEDENGQIVIALLAYCSGIPSLDGLLSDAVVKAMDDPQLRAELDGMDMLSIKASDTYRASFRVLEHLRRLGFCRAPDDQQDDEPEPQPQMPEPQEQEGEPDAQDDDSATGDDSSEDGDAGATEERSDNETAESSESDDEESTGGDSDADDSDDLAPGDDLDENGQDDGEHDDSDNGSDESDDDSDDTGSGPSDDDDTDEPGESQDEDAPGPEGESSTGSDESESDGEALDNDDEDSPESSESPGSDDNEDLETSESTSNEPGSSSEDDEAGEAGEGDEVDDDDRDQWSDDDDADSYEDDDDLDEVFEGGNDSHLQDGDDSDDDFDGTEAGEEGSEHTFDPGADQPGEVDEDAADERMDASDPDDVMRLLQVFGGHDPENDDYLDNQTERELGVAIIQSEQFDECSSTVTKFNIHHFDQPDERMVKMSWAIQNEDSRYSDYGCDDDISDYEMPESLVGGALLKMRTIFADNKKARQSGPLRHGNIMASKLPSVMTGNQKVFTRTRQPGKKDYFVLLALDVSGSTHGYRLENIKKMSMAIGSLLERAGVKFAIYAHSGGSLSYNRTTGDDIFEGDIFVIKEERNPWNTDAKNRLAKLNSSGNNLDGHALEFMRKRCDQSQATDKVILYVTDGDMPEANENDETVILKREIKECQKRRYSLIGVGMATESPRRHGLDTIRIDNPSDLTKLIRELEIRLAVKR